MRNPFKRAPVISVGLLVKGRIGDGWMDIDRTIKVAPDTTLGAFIDRVEAVGIPLRQAIADSPHLAHTLMLNGERCPVEENLARLLSDGDQIYLLAPLAGG
jgi:molybdopterin converting factor small subunit